jgi:flavin-dependent dehydrogenase
MNSIPPELQLNDGARIAVIGAGPAGALFTFFLLEMAERAEITFTVDIFEPRDFNNPGPAGCNNCGGVVSEWLVQALAMEGIELPPKVVQRGLEAYDMHLDVGSVRIETPHHEKRIATLHRGGGPRYAKESNWGSFDAFLFEIARQRGANWRKERVEALRYAEDGIQLKPHGGEFETYDLIAAATGKHAYSSKMFEALGTGYRRPKTSKTYISEIFLGNEEITKQLGSSMHLFLPDLPHVKFGALIPKGDYVTLCMLGDGFDQDSVKAFVSSPELTACLPKDWQMPAKFCHCSPSVAISGAAKPYANRLLFVGDCAVTRLYKDGIGAAYRSAKAAAVACVFHGVSEKDLKRHYWPVLQSIDRDNQYGRIIYFVTTILQRVRFLRRGVLRMIRREQADPERPPRMSSVLWDTFTGSAPYRDVFLRTLNPLFFLRLIADVATSFVTRR